MSVNDWGGDEDINLGRIHGLKAPETSENISVRNSPYYHSATRVCHVDSLHFTREASDVHRGSKINAGSSLRKTAPLVLHRNTVSNTQRSQHEGTVKIPIKYSASTPNTSAKKRPLNDNGEFGKKKIQVGTPTGSRKAESPQV